MYMEIIPGPLGIQEFQVFNSLFKKIKYLSGAHASPVLYCKPCIDYPYSVNTMEMAITLYL